MAVVLRLSTAGTWVSGLTVTNNPYYDLIGSARTSATISVYHFPPWRDYDDPEYGFDYPDYPCHGAITLGPSTPPFPDGRTRWVDQDLLGISAPIGADPGPWIEIELSRAESVLAVVFTECTETGSPSPPNGDTDPSTNVLAISGTSAQLVVNGQTFTATDTRMASIGGASWDKAKGVTSPASWSRPDASYWALASNYFTISDTNERWQQSQGHFRFDLSPPEEGWGIITT